MTSIANARRAQRAHGTVSAFLPLVVLATLDLLILSAALWFALRLHPAAPLAGSSPFALWATARWWLSLWAVWALVAPAVGIYEPALAGDPQRAVAFSVTALVVTAIVYLLLPVVSAPLIQPSSGASGAPGMAFLFTGLLGLAAWRSAYARYLVHAPLNRVALIGQSDALRHLQSTLKGVGTVQVAGAFGPGAGVLDAPSAAYGLSVLGPLADLVRLSAEHGLNGVIVDDRALSEAAQERVVGLCLQAGLRIWTPAACYEAWLGVVSLDHLDVNAWLGDLHRGALRLHIYERFARAAALLVGAVGALLVLLFLPAVALIPGRTWGASLFCTEPCLGSRGLPFALHRFRGPLPAWLAALPMAWNLLLGEMALFGPRPLQPWERPGDARLAALCQLRASVPPGLTGWAQVRAPHAPPEDRLAAELPYDLYYVKHRGLSRDLAVLYHLLTERPA